MKNKILIIISLIVLTLIYYFYYSSKTNEIVYEDKNKNEIWDDVEGYISKNSKTPDEKKALEYMLQTYQALLLNPEKALKFKEIHGPTDFSRAFDCLYSVYNEYHPGGQGPKEAILTTWARHKAWAKYNAYLGGGVYHSWDEERNGDPCPFRAKAKGE